MITNHHSWSLGSTPNKSLDRPQAAAAGHNCEPFIPIHPPGDPTANIPRTHCVHRPFLLLTTNPVALALDHVGDPLATSAAKNCTCYASYPRRSPSPVQKSGASLLTGAHLFPLQRSGMCLTCYTSTARNRSVRPKTYKSFTVLPQPISNPIVSHFFALYRQFEIFRNSIFKPSIFNLKP
jgi:hypothetical protein